MLVATLAQMPFSMEKIFNRITNINRVSESVRKQIAENIDDTIKQIDEKLIKLNRELDRVDLEQLYIFYNNFSFDEKTIFTEQILIGLFNYYLQHVDRLITSDAYQLNLLLDLFFHNPKVYDDEENTRLLLIRTYPLLTCQLIRNSDSNVDIAISFYLSALCWCLPPNDIGIELIKKFIRENPENPYVDDAKEELSEFEERQ